MASRVAIFVYGVLAYLVFFGNLSLCDRLHRRFRRAEVDGLGAGRRFPAEPADRSRPAGTVRAAAQHHGAPGFKRWLTRSVPEAAERSTYVLASSLALIALFAYWQPLGGIVWSVADPAPAASL